MVIEWLKVTVEKDEIDRYIQLDQAIWTPVLAACDGFHKKEVWWSPDGEIVMVVWWNTREQWKSIPEATLDETDRTFTEALGYPVKFLEAREYNMTEGDDRSAKIWSSY